MPSDDLRQRAFEFACQALQARRLAQGLSGASDRMAMERYAAELSEKAIALMAGAPRAASETGCDLLLRSFRTLEASKPRYP